MRGSTLREILLTLAKAEPKVERVLYDGLFLIEEGGHVADRWKWCMKCHQFFDSAAVSEEGECLFHPTDVKVDWEELRSDYFLAPECAEDNAQNRELYYNCFCWRCCKGDGRSQPCARGRHEARKEEPKVDGSDWSIKVEVVTYTPEDIKATIRSHSSDDGSSDDDGTWYP